MDIRGHGETSVRWDDFSARAALAANLREPGRMHALRTMIALSKATRQLSSRTAASPPWW